MRRLSTDPFHNPASQHETAVEPDSFAWGSQVVAVFQVGRRVDGGAAGIGFAASTDAGRTWRTGMLPALTAESAPAGSQSLVSDPAVAYDAAHGVWLATALGVTGTSAILVSRSTDAVHWSGPTIVATGSLLDKEWIACDNGAASQFRGRCYVVYTDDAAHQLISQTSTDGGRTWSTPVRISLELIGAQPLPRPDGSLVVLAVSLSQSDRAALLAFTSTDGGASFTSTTVANFVWHEPQGMRAPPLPSGTVGPDGRLYASWHECPTDASCTANDIVLTTSADGTTWTAPALVTHGGTDHFVTGLDADPTQPGRLGLVYELFEPGSCARGACQLGAAFTTSSDDGATWRPPRRLDAAPFAQAWLARSEGRMVGDYFSTSFAGDRVVPVFTLAEPPLGNRLREAIFAASLPAR